MKDANIYFSDSAQGWVLEVLLHGCDWTKIACFGSKKAATEHFKKNYMQRGAT